MRLVASLANDRPDALSDVAPDPRLVVHNPRGRRTRNPGKLSDPFQCQCHDGDLLSPGALPFLGQHAGHHIAETGPVCV